MPDAKSRPGTSLAIPKPKKPTPNNEMDIPEDDPWVTPKKTTGRGRSALQVNRKLTAKEWQTIARSMNDRRRPYAPRPVGRGRVGGRVRRNKSSYGRMRPPPRQGMTLMGFRRRR